MTVPSTLPSGLPMLVPAKKIRAPSPVCYGEPEGIQYQRGQIQWGMANGDIVGRAYVQAGPGVYTHLAYFRGPKGRACAARSSCRIRSGSHEPA